MGTSILANFQAVQKKKKNHGWLVTLGEITKLFQIRVLTFFFFFAYSEAKNKEQRRDMVCAY